MANLKDSGLIKRDRYQILEQGGKCLDLSSTLVVLHTFFSKTLWYYLTFHLNSNTWCGRCDGTYLRAGKQHGDAPTDDTYLVRELHVSETLSSELE